MSGNNSSTVYVGNLPRDIKEKDVYRLFNDYGDAINVQIKSRSTCCYAFIQFKNYHVAADVVHDQNGCSFGGNRLSVQLARSCRGNSYAVSSYPPRHSYTGISHHVQKQVLVTRLPSSAEAIELKEHMEQAGKVCFSEIRHQRTGTIGIVEYEDIKNMKFAAKMLNCSEFRNNFSRCYVDVKPYNSEDWPSPRSASRSRSRSRSRSGSRSRSRSRTRGHSRSRRHGRSRSHSRSRRHGRSRSRSRTRGHSRSRRHGRSRSHSRSRRHGRSRSRSRSRSRRHSQTRSRSRTRGHSRSRSQTRSHSPCPSDVRHESRSDRRRSQ